MSLVNDALKRAKAAQDKQNRTPLRGAPLHYAEPPPPSRMWLVALVCFVLAVVVAIGGIWYWKKNPHPQWFQAKPEPAPAPAYKIIIGDNPDAATKPKPAHPPVAAPVAAPVATPATPTPPVAKTELPQPTVPAAEPATKTETVHGTLVVDKRPTLNVRPPVAVPAPPVVTAAVAVAPATPPAVVTPSVVVPPVIPPVELKLQGILYSATKPTAILNGRTLAIGDHFDGIIITSIEPDRITITYSNQPFVLRMP